MPDRVVLIAASVLGHGLILQLVGLVTTAWNVFSVASLKTEYGLWKMCSDGYCFDYAFEPEALGVVRAFGVLAVLAMAASLSCVLLRLVSGEHKVLSRLTSLAAAAGAISALAQLAIFAVRRQDMYIVGDLGYSFVVTAVASVFSLVAALLFSIKA